MANIMMRMKCQHALTLLVIGALAVTVVQKTAAQEGGFERVDIGGRSLTIFCAGEGNPTVVIMPSGNSIETVFSWDPPVGWSVVFSEVSVGTELNDWGT